MSGSVHGLAWSVPSVHLSTAMSRLVGVGCGCHRAPLKPAAAAVSEFLSVPLDQAVKERLRQVGYASIAGGPEVLKQRIAKEVPFFKELVASAKIPQIE